MTKRVLTLVPALLLSLLINAQNLIIPRPVTEKAGEGHFVLNEKTSITSNEKNSFNLKYLKGKNNEKDDEPVDIETFLSANKEVP